MEQRDTSQKLGITINNPKKKTFKITAKTNPYPTIFVKTSQTLPHKYEEVHLCL